MGQAPLGIYVHIPFCTGKCPYCDFNSRPARPHEVETYVAALETEIALRLRCGDAADTIYFGGGTPTVLAPSLLARLLRAIEARVHLASNTEISIESNPETLTPGGLAELRAAGFNRLSIGAQSFDDDLLAALGRRHDAARALAAAHDARAVGWNNISLDLIFGIPGQSASQWTASLEQAIALGPQHISTYCLTLEPGTELHRRQVAGEIRGLGEEAELDMYVTARRTLRAAGYEHYEVSNFARPGHRCRHNEKYWHGGDYIGLGAGAHSRQAGVRWANSSEPDRYCSLLERGKLPVGYVERLCARRRMDEDLILALRTADGACLVDLGRQCGRDAESEYRSTIDALSGAGLAVTDGSRLALTERGIALASEVAMLVMS